MKTLLALGCTSACLLLVGCGGDESPDVTTIDSNQVRQPGSAQVAPPGDGIKLGSNSSGGPGATPPAKKDE